MVFCFGYVLQNQKLCYICAVNLPNPKKLQIMKKLVLLAAVLVSASAASAQFTYGVKAGANLANISSSDKVAAMISGETGLKSEGKMLPSFHVGAFGEYKVSDLFSVAAEAVYSGQGAKADLSGSIESVAVKGDAKINFGYLNVPILAKFYVTEDLSLDLGPQFGFLMSSKVSTSTIVEGTTVKTEDKSKEGLNKTDISAALGLTYNFSNFFVQGRYNLGLNEFVKDNEGDDKFKNNVIQLGVGYRF
jgi:hypothetical protein